MITYLKKDYFRAPAQPYLVNVGHWAVDKLYYCFAPGIQYYCPLRDEKSEGQFLNSSVTDGASFSRDSIVDGVTYFFPDAGSQATNYVSYGSKYQVPRTRAVPVTGLVMARYIAADPNQTVNLMATPYTSDKPIPLVLNWGSGTYQGASLYGGGGITGWKATGLGSGDNIRDGKWHIAAGTVDGTYVKLFIDGTYRRQVAHGFSALTDGNVNIHLGNYTNDNRAWRGHIGLGLYWYDKALSKEEIADLSENPWQIFKTHNRVKYFLPAESRYNADNSIIVKNKEIFDPPVQYLEINRNNYFGRNCTFAMVPNYWGKVFTPEGVKSITLTGGTLATNFRDSKTNDLVYITINNDNHIWNTTNDSLRSSFTYKSLVVLGIVRSYASSASKGYLVQLHTQKSGNGRTFGISDNVNTTEQITLSVEINGTNSTQNELWTTDDYIPEYVRGSNAKFFTYAVKFTYGNSLTSTHVPPVLYVAGKKRIMTKNAVATATNTTSPVVDNFVLGTLFDGFNTDWYGGFKLLATFNGEGITEESLAELTLNPYQVFKEQRRYLPYRNNSFFSSIFKQ